MSSADDSPKLGRHSGNLGRINALIENGWLRILSQNELALWLSLTKHAPSSGLLEKSPGDRLLASHLGHKSDKRIGKLRQRLVRYGLLEIVSQGGGSGHRAIVQLLTPPAAPLIPIPRESKPSAGLKFTANPRRNGTPSKLRTPPEVGNKPPPVRSINPPRSGDLLNKDEQTLEQTIEQTNTPSADKPPRGNGSALSLQSRVMAEIWKPKWAAAHNGADYSPRKVDYVKVAEILNAIGAKADPEAAVAHFEKIADAALAQPEEYGWQGHKLTFISSNLPYLNSEAAKAAKGRRHGTSRTNGQPGPKTIDEGLRVQCETADGGN